MSEDSLVRIDDLYRYFGAHCAVNRVSFEVRRGEVLGFLGPNGAGKSTTMRMLTGNLAPSGGRITVGGVDILEHPKRAKAAIGYLPEQPPLYRELTVDEYLTYCARLHRIESGRIAAALSAARERCGLADSGGRLIGNLSKGYQQRVGIAQAIIHSPDVVVLDEPTVGLDPIQIREIRALIRELGGEHSVILSTHILPEVQATCDRVQIINRGELVVSDSIAGLEQRMQTSRLTVALHRPPRLEKLTALDGVVSVEESGDGRFHIGHDPARSPAEALVLAAAREDWGLYELIPERRSLEDIFVDLTTSEPAQEEAA